MTQEQLSGQLIGDEAYAGARNFERLQQAVHDVVSFLVAEVGAADVVYFTWPPPFERQINALSHILDVDRKVDALSSMHL